MGFLAFPAALIVALMLSTSAFAAPKVTVRSTTFTISGKTGSALLAELERKGPRHGFLARAIAQTRYTMNSEAEWRHDAGNCRVTRPLVSLDITYTYPKLNETPSAQMAARWKRFMAGVVKHEEVHGRLAREMAHAAERAIVEVRTTGDTSGCTKLKREMKRRVDRIIADYEARQRKFDLAEHKDGGNVERLVEALAR